MTRSYTYLMEKYTSLIHGMIIGKGNIKERLLENSVLLHMVFGLEFPDQLKSQKEQIIKRLKKFPAIIRNGKIVVSSYNRTIGKSRYATNIETTTMIANLYYEMIHFLNFNE